MEVGPSVPLSGAERPVKWGRMSLFALGPSSREAELSVHRWVSINILTSWALFTKWVRTILPESVFHRLYYKIEGIFKAGLNNLFA